jgi:hypothetical protein
VLRMRRGSIRPPNAAADCSVVNAQAAPAAGDRSCPPSRPAPGERADVHACSGRPANRQGSVSEAWAVRRARDVARRSLGARRGAREAGVARRAAGRLPRPPTLLPVHQRTSSCPWSSGWRRKRIIGDGPCVGARAMHRWCQTFTTRQGNEALHDARAFDPRRRVWVAGSPSGSRSHRESSLGARNDLRTVSYAY